MTINATENSTPSAVTAPPSKLGTLLNWLSGGAFVALVGIGFTWWQSSTANSIEYGQSKALLTTRTQELESSRAENSKLAEQKEHLETDIDKLRQELMQEKADNLYTKKLLGDSASAAKQLQAQVDQLSAITKNFDPCASERNQVEAIEEQLAIPSMVSGSLTEARRVEALAARDKKYEMLSTCLKARQ